MALEPEYTSMRFLIICAVGLKAISCSAVCAISCGCVRVFRAFIIRTMQASIMYARSCESQKGHRKVSDWDEEADSKNESL